jgi:hypothetical protein
MPKIDLLELDNCAEEYFDDVIYSDELEQPYLSGIWCEYTRAKVAENKAKLAKRKSSRAANATQAADTPSEATINTSEAAKNVSAGNTVRPRIMPQEAHLPQGVSACAIPAAAYICTRVKQQDVEGAVERLVALVRGMRVRPMDAASEMALSQQPFADVEEIRPNGPFVEPFSEPRMVGDGAYMGKMRAIDERELEGVERWGGIGLRPQDDFIVLCEKLPQEAPNDEPIYEVQLLCHEAKRLL